MSNDTTSAPATIDVAALQELVAADDAPRLIDVRTPAEFDTAHIPGSYNVPLDLHNPDNAVNYHLAGMWLNFVVSAVMIAMFVARLSGVLRQREAQLNLAREQLLREARVEDLNGQAAAVAHEIGTPLATLAVIAGELRADASDEALGTTPIRSYLPDLQTVEQQLVLCRTTLARLREDSATLAPQRLDASTGSIPDHVRMAVDAAGRGVIVWEDSTAVRRRVLLRPTTDGGRTFGPVQSLSPALKAYAPDVAVSPTGGFVAVWHEEQFPVIKTVVQPLHFKDGK